MIDLARRYVLLVDERARLEAALDDVKSRLSTLEPHLVDAMQSDQVESLRVEGRTVSLRREIWASLRDREAGVAALQAAGLGDMVRASVNHQTLSAWVRERVRDAPPGEDLSLALDVADDLREQIRITEQWRARATK